MLKRATNEKKVFHLLQAHSTGYFTVSTGTSKIRRKSWYFGAEAKALVAVHLGVKVITTKKQNQLSRYE